MNCKAVLLPCRLSSSLLLLSTEALIFSCITGRPRHVSGEGNKREKSRRSRPPSCCRSGRIEQRGARKDASLLFLEETREENSLW